MNIKIRKTYFSIVTVVILMSGCMVISRQKNINELFTLTTGYDTEQIGMISNGIFSPDNLNIVYQNGFFYLSDRINNKIIKISERGDILLTIFNPETNLNLTDNTTSADEKTEEEKVFLKIFASYPLNSPGRITVSEQKEIFVAAQTRDKKTENGRVLDNVIIKLSEKGELIYTIGRSGLSTDPFDYIESIIVDNDSKLVVIERNSIAGYNIYRYEPDGTLISKTSIDDSSVPHNQKETESATNIIKIAASKTPFELYITCQFVNQIESGIYISRPELAYEKVFKYSLKTGSYTRLVLQLEQSTVDITRELISDELKAIYDGVTEIPLAMKDFLTATGEGYIYMTRRELVLSDPSQNILQLYLYSPRGKIDSIERITFPPRVSYISELIYGGNSNFFAYYINAGDIYFVSVN